MAGTNPDFDAAAFRDGVRTAMVMGASPVDDEKVLFHFASQLVYTGGGKIDADGVPFDPATTVQRVTPPPVHVPCAVEYVDAPSVPTNVGFIAPTKLRITLLDEDYLKVEGTTHVTVAGDVYRYRRTEPPKGIFDAGLYVLHFVAENDT